MSTTHNAVSNLQGEEKDVDSINAVPTKYPGVKHHDYGAVDCVAYAFGRYDSLFSLSLPPSLSLSLSRSLALSAFSSCRSFFLARSVSISVFPLFPVVLKVPIAASLEASRVRST